MLCLHCATYVQVACQFAHIKQICVKWLADPIQPKRMHCKIIAIISCKGNLYEINFLKVEKVNLANLLQSPIGDGAFEFCHHRLRHCNVKGVHKLQNMVSDMNTDKLSCPISSLLWEASIANK